MVSLIAFKAFVALMLAVVWAAYLRKINLFGRIHWSQVLVTVIIGGLSTLIVLNLDLPLLPGMIGHHEVLDKFIVYTYQVALMEEAAKFFGFLVMVVAFQRWFREEPNYITYAALTALGFATVENYLKFYTHGVSLVYMRGMMSTVSHMIGTSVIAGFMVVGLRKNLALAILFTFFGLIVATLMHGLYDFFISLGGVYFFIITLIIFSVEIEIWARLINNFLNFSRRINLKKSVDRNTLQRFLLIVFMTAGTIQLIGLLYERGWEQGIRLHLQLLIQELIITLILIVRITRFTIIPRHWTPIWPVLPVTIRWGKFQRSMIPTSPNFFLRIRGDEFNEYRFTSCIDQEVKLRSLPNKDIDFNTEVTVKVITKKFIGPKKEIYYLCEIMDFHTIHPQYNSRFVLIRPKNYGKVKFKGKPIVGLIALKGFANTDDIQPGDCKFISWMVFNKEMEKTRLQRMKEMFN